MKLDRKLIDEEGRLDALRRYDVLDTAPEAPFDKLTELIRNVLGVPIAAVSLIDAERQWFKSIAGLNACETSLEISFCAHAALLQNSDRGGFTLRIHAVRRA